MRHTLLPLQDRIMLRREYYTRFLIVFCFVVSLGIILGITSLFPTFIKAMMAEREAKTLVVNASKDPEDPQLKTIQQNISRSQALLNSLVKDQSFPRISDLINGVISSKGSLHFDSFTAEKTSTTTFSMTIQGVSPTRNALLTFKKEFENLSPDNKVDLPVSELARNSNIQFSLQLKEKIQ